jgi:hypothetical protein
MRRAKSLRIGVHHANAVVWGPVYGTHLNKLREVLRELAGDHLVTDRGPAAAAARRARRRDRLLADDLRRLGDGRGAQDVR